MSDERAPPISVRPMNETDVPGLVELWVASRSETMPSIDFDFRRGWIAAFLADPAHTTLVAEREAPCGFVSLENRLLHQLVVAPTAKGTGVARRLLAAAQGAAPEGLDLEVNQDNARAIRFYDREGFVRVADGENPTSGLRTWRMTWRSAPRDS